MVTTLTLTGTLKRRDLVFEIMNLPERSRRSA